MNLNSDVHAAMISFVRESLIKLLDDRVPGIKALVLDPKLSGPLSLVAEFSLLKDRGVDKIYHLEEGPIIATPCEKIIYLTRAKASLMKTIAKQIKGLESDQSQTRRQYFICVVPRRSIVCERVLEDEGVFGSVQIDEFAFDWVPLEQDLYSLEWENSFADLFLRKNEECLFVLARALAKFQGILGTPQKISGRGEFSKVRYISSREKH